MIPLPAIYEVKRAVITIGAGTSQDVVALVADKKIAVIAYMLSSNAAVTMTFKSHETGITGAMPVAVNAPLQDANVYGLFITTAGVKLNLTASGTATVGGYILYCEV